MAKCGLGVEVGGVEHSMTTHEGHVFGGAVASAERSMDNCNCVVLEAWAVSICNGGLTVDFGLALHSPLCKGAATAFVVEGAGEDETSSVVSEVGAEEANDSGESHEAASEVGDAAVACLVS